MAVITSFADQYRQELSAERIKEVKAHLNDTTFAWIGSNGSDAPIYYRIQSPVLLIEFDQQRAVGEITGNGFPGNMPCRVAWLAQA